MIAKVAVSAALFAIDKPYSYRIPDGMVLRPGQRVQLPFGRGNQRTEGVVLSVEEGNEEKLKTIERCLDEEPILTPAQLRLAGFLRERYFCTFYDAIRAILPAGLWFQTKASYSLTDDLSWKEKPSRKEDAMAVLQLMEDLGGQADETALRNLIADEEVLESTLSYLVKKKWITAHTEFQRRTSDKTEKIVTLASSPEEAMEYASHRPKSASQQKAVVELMCALGSVSAKELCYFTGAKMPTLKRLEALGYVTLSERPVLRCREIRPVKLDSPLVLNEEQQTCFEGIKSQMTEAQPGIALLYGITGSGKTSVYIKLIQSCLDQGKAAMLLVPEIALTPQLLGLLAAYFGESVAVLHSSLAPGERYDQWKRVRSGEAKVVVGTRSAVFAPMVDPGLIILDEEQEHSYKSENSPRYDAREVALWRGSKEKALVLLGSATPAVETMYYAKTGVFRLYCLKNRYNGKRLPKVEIVDMRQELKNGNDSPFSEFLLDAMRDNIAHGDQTILFLNRRGNSRALVCVDCRETPECPRCDQRMTYHSANHRLMCHYCGHSQPAPERCPSCGGPMKPIGTGTQKVQEELAFLFPEMEVSRMDADTVSASNPHERILDHFRDEKVPVLIGTQMVAKGLNLPNVTLVGVLNADQMLYADDYRSYERTFSLLAQVVGRAGRRTRPGRAVIQTYTPEHPVIQAAAAQDYDAFYEQEILTRQALKAPPFADQFVFRFGGTDEHTVQQAAQVFAKALATQLAQTPDVEPTVLGPVPAPIAKLNKRYFYTVSFRGRATNNSRALVSRMLAAYDRWPGSRSLTVSADIDPYYI